MVETPVNQLVSILAASIAPVIVISGVGLLLLTMTNRFGRVVDRARELTSVIAQPDMAGRHSTVILELRILYRRAQFLRSAIFLGCVSILFVGLTVFALFTAQLAGARTDIVSVPCFALCLLSLLGSLYFFMRDVGFSLTALELEIPAECRVSSSEPPQNAPRL